MIVKTEKVQSVYLIGSLGIYYEKFGMQPQPVLWKRPYVSFVSEKNISELVENFTERI